MKSNSVPYKVGEGWPAPAPDSAVTSRLPERTILSVDEFAVRNGCTRSEAIRRLVEIGLAKAPKDCPAGPHKGAAKASDLAGTQIDRLADASATDEQWQKRKRRILSGPTEFREIRKDQSKRKPRRARTIPVAKLNASNEV